MESVRFRAGELRQDPFEELGRAVIRAEQDILFNKTMVEAWKRYILDNNLAWDAVMG